MLINILAFPLYILPPSGFPVRSRGSFIPMQVTHCLLRGESNKETLSPSSSRCSCCSRENNRCSSSSSLSLSHTEFPLFLSQVSPPRRVGEIEGRCREVSLGGENGEKGEITRASNGRRDFFQVKLRPLILLTSDRGERDDARCRWLLEILSGEGEGGV